MPAPRKVTVARLLHYWTYEGAQLVPNPALVLAVGDDGARVWVHVFWATGAGGRDCLWAPQAPFTDTGEQDPTEGHWTWPKRV